MSPQLGGARIKENVKACISKKRTAVEKTGTCSYFSQYRKHKINKNNVYECEGKHNTSKSMYFKVMVYRGAIPRKTNGRSSPLQTRLCVVAFCARLQSCRPDKKYKKCPPIGGRKDKGKGKSAYFEKTHGCEKNWHALIFFTILKTQNQQKERLRMRAQTEHQQKRVL